MYFLLLGILFGFGLKDYDNLLLRDEISIHTLIIQLLNIPALSLLFVNILIVSFVLSNVYYRYRLLYFLLLFNPFIVLNTLDAYNKFSFSILILMLIDYLGHRKIIIIPITSLLTMSIHPFLVPVNYYQYLSSVRNLMVVFLIAILFLFMTPLIHSFLLEYSVKYQLFVKFGGDIASTYSGDMVISSSYSSMSLHDFSVRFVAYIFPYGFIEKSSVLVFLLSIYNVVLLFVISNYLRLNSLLVLLFIYILISAFVGNFAVAQRHILPIILFFVYVNNKKRKFRMGRFKI